MRKTILVVDDEDHMIRLLQFALRPTGAIFASAKSGEVALEYLRERSPDLIILDYSMPGGNGVETLRQIREHPDRALLPVIMLTARDQTTIRAEANGLNVAAFLTKPFSPSDLQRRAREILGI